MRGQGWSCSATVLQLRVEVSWDALYTQPALRHPRRVLTQPNAPMVPAPGDHTCDRGEATFLHCLPALHFMRLYSRAKDGKLLGEISEWFLIWCCSLISVHSARVMLDKVGQVSV